MVAVSVETVGKRAGKDMVQAVLVSDTTPSPLPTDGTNVVGMNENQVFAPMSLLYVTGEAEHKIFVTGENGTFVPQ